MFHFPEIQSSHPTRPSSETTAQHNRARNQSTLSIASRYSTYRATALEIYELIYGNNTSPLLNQTPSEIVERVYETDAVYENPLITANSRRIIAEINALARTFSNVDIPRPLAMLKTLFGLGRNSGGTTANTAADSAWFQALRVWSDLEHVCESESFDGHHTSVIEHTINILFLPGLHADWRRPQTSSPTSGRNGLNFSTDSLDYTPSLHSSFYAPHALRGSQPQSQQQLHHTTVQSYQHQQPNPHHSSISISIPGIPLPSPLHRKLRVLTRLSFNEQGRVTKHRDLCDVRDVIGLVPGGKAAAWIATSITARSLALAGSILQSAPLSRLFFSSIRPPHDPHDPDMKVESSLHSPPQSPMLPQHDPRRRRSSSGIPWNMGGGYDGPLSTRTSVSLDVDRETGSSDDHTESPSQSPVIGKRFSLGDYSGINSGVPGHAGVSGTSSHPSGGERSTLTGSSFGHGHVGVIGVARGNNVAPLVVSMHALSSSSRSTNASTRPRGTGGGIASSNETSSNTSLGALFVGVPSGSVGRGVGISGSGGGGMSLVTTTNTHRAPDTDTNV